jgi:hypothetical protein
MPLINLLRLYNELAIVYLTAKKNLHFKLQPQLGLFFWLLGPDLTR